MSLSLNKCLTTLNFLRQLLVNTALLILFKVLTIKRASIIDINAQTGKSADGLTDSEIIEHVSNVTTIFVFDCARQKVCKACLHGAHVLYILKSDEQKSSLTMTDWFPAFLNKTSNQLTSSGGP